MAEMGMSPNRIELESQILCASLRQSWAQEDTHGVIVVAKQLCQLFPDLIKPLSDEEQTLPLDLYGLLGLTCDATQNAVIGAYIRSVNSFMQENNVRDRAEDYYTLLDAGYILRKPRLRLSHDLFAVRHWLLEQQAIPTTGTIDFLETVKIEKPVEPVVADKAEQLPKLVYLMQQAQIIGQPEVLALTNQINLAPEVTIEELILSAGYLSENELKSVQLGEFLLQQGKITMPQFIVAMYDERERGIRMAESLQSRGWLEVQVKTFSGQ
jgi:hypothetical protein